MYPTDEKLRFLQILADGDTKTYVHVVRGFGQPLTPMAPTFTNRIASGLLRHGFKEGRAAVGRVSHYVRGPGIAVRVQPLTRWSLLRRVNRDFPVDILVVKSKDHSAVESSINCRAKRPATPGSSDNTSGAGGPLPPNRVHPAPDPLPNLLVTGLSNKSSNPLLCHVWRKRR